MKKLVFSAFCCILLGLTASAATKQYSRNLAPFSGISVSDKFDVSLVRGSEYRALLSVEEAYIDYVVCAVNGSVLEVSLDERKVPSEVKRQFRAKGTADPVFSAVIYVPDLLQSVELKDKAVLHDTEDLFDKSRVSFELSGNSQVKTLTLSSLSLKIKMQNKATGDFMFTGGECIVDMSNSSSLRIVERESTLSRYTLQGTSKVDARCTTQTLDIQTKGNCYMSVSGSGDKAVFNINGTSEVDASAFEVPDAVVSMSSVCRLSEAAYKTLRVNLNGGSTLFFAGEPAVTIENIRSATMTRISSGNTTTSL